MRWMLGLVLMVAACGGSKEAAPTAGSGSDRAGSAAAVALPPEGPVEITVTPIATGNLYVQDGLGKGSYYPSPELVITANVAGPAGTVIAWQGQTAKLTDQPLAIAIDIRDLALRAELGAKHHRLPIVVTAPGKPAVTATIAFDAGPEIAFLAAAAKQPVAFPGDDRSTQRADVAMIVFDGGFYAGTISKREGAVRLYDTDVVVFRTQKDRVVKDCGAYSDGKTQVRRKILARDADDAIYDRRTGKQVATRSFAASSEASCEKSFVMGGATPDGKFETLDQTFSEADEHAWISTFLTAPTGAEIEVPPTTAAGIAKAGASAIVASSDPGTGFPTPANLAARMRALGWQPNAPTVSKDPYPAKLRISSGSSEGPCVTLYDYSGADRQPKPTVVHVGPRRALYATIDEPARRPWLDKVAAKLPTMKPESAKALGGLFAGTGLHTEKDKFSLNTDDATDEPRSWTARGNDREDYTMVTVEISYYGHLLGPGADAEVAVSGDRVVIVGCLAAAERKAALAALIR
ncbi:MAG: hypothetical protein IPQ07_34600 [Myxococcales bacterium]|nr:hypothetical protein [Myxococcales bacterium]